VNAGEAQPGFEGVNLEERDAAFFASRGERTIVGGGVNRGALPGVESVVAPVRREGVVGLRNMRVAALDGLLEVSSNTCVAALDGRLGREWSVGRGVGVGALVEEMWAGGGASTLAAWAAAGGGGGGGPSVSE